MAQYEMQESNLPNSEGKRILYPRMKLTGQDTLEDITKQIEQSTAFTEGDVKGLVASLVYEIAYRLGQGHSVKIEGLGVFTPALGLRKGFERETGEQRRNAQSIILDDIHFKPDKQLVQEANSHCHLERSKQKFRKSSNKYTPEQRLKLAQDYLEEHPYMTVKDYRRLTGLLQTSACKELNRWSNQPDSGIDARGYASHKVFVRKDIPTE